MNDVRNKLWVEKYRPQRIDDCILPAGLKTTFNKFVADEFVPNLLLVGSPGCGKTTVAKALLQECDFDFMVINGSMNGNIDTLRVDIQNFASTVSFTGRRKYVILDEADYLNANSTQPALRNFMEEFSKNCGFILTGNYKNRIIDALQSRCSVIDFSSVNNPKEKMKLLAAFMRRCMSILDIEHVKYDKGAIAEVIKASYPDYRRILNELQRYAGTGEIDSGILVNMNDENYKTLVGFLKAKNFTEMRKWVVENLDLGHETIFRNLYNNASLSLKKESIPQLVIHIAEYSYKAAFIVDQEINLVAALTEIMADCDFA